MGSQPRRSTADTESVSLWQTCWTHWLWQDERKGLCLIKWCFSWTSKLWLQFNLSFLIVVFLFLFQVASWHYWARLLEDCDEIVKRCNVCQRTSNKFQKPSAQLHPIKIKDTVWLRIGIDLVGPLPETSRGNKYLITCTCCFSKWPEAAPLKSKSAEGM